MDALSSLPPPLRDRLAAHFERTVSLLDATPDGGPETLCLAGGYGRGEGGVVEMADGSFAFFNDLDYFLFARDPADPALVHAIHSWEKRETAALGIDVECKLLTRSQIEDPSTSMMFYDFLSAHHRVWGMGDWLTAEAARIEQGKLPPIEATRLLWNRGSGLFFALEAFERDDLAFIHRNQSKAKLAIGDAHLVLQRRYHYSVRERDARLRSDSSVDPRLAELHAEGAAFKLRPTPSPDRTTLEATQADLTALWLEVYLKVESARLGTTFSTPHSYTDFGGQLVPESPRWRNLVLALRDRLKRGGFLRPVTDYPRGALQRALVQLLTIPPGSSAESVRRWLPVPKSPEDWRPARWKDVYEEWWFRYS